MAKNNKSHKSSSKNVKIALGVTIGVIAVCVIGWFIYISGIIPQLLPGMTVYETAPDGVTLQKVESVSVLETHSTAMLIGTCSMKYTIPPQARHTVT